MTEIGDRRWRITRFATVIVTNFVLASMIVSAERSSMIEDVSAVAVAGDGEDGDGLRIRYFVKLANYLFQTDGSGYQHVWPEMEFGWKIVLGSFIGFCGAAFGSVGGVGGGGIFVPMLMLIIGFDPKSATAISKCMIMGAAASTVYYNLKLRHPTLDMPIIDYDLALLIQPMLMLGISIGVAFNVIFADWMVTVLLIILFIGTSTKAFCRGVETWNKETIMKMEAAKRLENNDNAEAEYKILPGGPSNGSATKPERLLKTEVTILENVCWKELGLLVFVWIAFLALQLGKNYTSACSVWYWVLNLSQIPIAFGVSRYEAVSLYKGTRTISSMGDLASNQLSIGQLVLYCSCGVLAGLVGGLLGLGGGFIMGPLFLELGVPPQVSSATATFAMTFSSSMSVVEYYLLKRFPVPYAAYFLLVATIAAFVGQHVVRKLIMILGRASLIIFILAFTIFVSAISLGGVGISNMIGKIERQEYMGFENLCKYEI
ncbi:putative transmembrane protein TauE [Helianthus anomalus]